ncbi:MAG: hypothetical protein E3J71_06495 [Candidatus Stahlbacteria bacterium]|nr:MAG: hypothetical protein E3J71_06495 [Candidatus Stahlbacteria bacterium]
MILLVLGGLTSIKAVTRKEILARAQSFAELTWFADSANTVAWEEMYERYGCEEHLTSDWDACETYQDMAYGFGQNDDTVTYIEKLDDSLAAWFGESTARTAPVFTINTILLPSVKRSI